MIQIEKKLRLSLRSKINHWSWQLREPLKNLFWFGCGCSCGHIFGVGAGGAVEN